MAICKFEVQIMGIALNILTYIVSRPIMLDGLCYESVYYLASQTFLLLQNFLKSRPTNCSKLRQRTSSAKSAGISC